MRSNISPKSIHEFAKVPMLSVILLSIFTFHIYTLYWMFSRTQQLNKIHPKPIPLALAIIVIGIYVLMLLVGLSLDKEVMIDELPTNTQMTISLISWSWFLLSNYWVILFYWKLLEVTNAATNNDAKLGVDVILAVLFSAIFFQYKINQAQAAAALTHTNVGSSDTDSDSPSNSTSHTDFREF